MICSKCKKEIPDESKYCLYCGRIQGTPNRGKSKRGNGLGTAYMHHGSWTVRVTVARRTDDDGITRQVYRTKGGFKKKSDALAYAQELRNGPLTVPEMTVDNVFKQWAESYRERVGASTMNGYRAAYKHFSAVHQRMISTIRPAELQAQIDACPQGKRTKEVMKVVAGLLWKYAEDNDLVKKNISSNLYTGIDDGGTWPPFSEMELARIRQAVGVEPYADYVVALCYTGFRPGELLKLKKDAYNPDFGYLVGGGKTKAGTNRLITIPPAIIGIIKDRAAVESTDFLFPDLDTMQAMNHEHFRNCCFNPLMKKLGITGKVPYSCRHTYSNLLKNAPGDSGDKARLMGHTDYAFTQGRYQSAALNDLRTITDALI